MKLKTVFIAALLQQLPLFITAKTLDIFHTDCFNETLQRDKTCSAAATFVECVAGTHSCRVGGLGVAQWSVADKTCRLFNYQQVCAQLKTAGRSDQASPTTCRTVIGTKYDAIEASRLFTYFWVGDTSTGQMENVACSNNEATMMSTGVTWTDEGPRLYGTNESRLWSTEITTSTILNSISIVVRLKRRPKKNVFLELSDCDTLQDTKMRIIEQNRWDPNSSTPNGALYVDLGPFQTYYTNESALTNNEHQFATVAVAFSRTFLLAPPDTFDVKIFVDNLVIPHGHVPQYINMTNSSFWVSAGWSGAEDPANFLDGVISAVGVSDMALDVSEMQRVFKYTD